MKVIFFSIYGILFFTYCSSSNKNNSLANKNVFCQKIDSLIYERYTLKSGNYFANIIIPDIETESKIEANCQKGFYGHLYSSDSLFDADIEKWKKYFNCK
jgi:hypothetical protein